MLRAVPSIADEVGLRSLARAESQPCAPPHEL